jgi:protein ImuB
VFGALSTVEGASSSVLSEVAREFSPRIEVCGHTEIVLDLNGLTRLFGDARTIAEELRRTAADRGLRVRVAIAGTRTAARLLVRHRAGLTIIEPGHEAAAVASLPLDLLGELSSDFVAELGTRESRALNSRVPSPGSRIPDVLATFRRWGLRTLGDLAALPADDLAARLGRQETDWQRLARGEDTCPLVPAVPEERFEQSLDLEWPIEELEPLSFVLGRLMDQLEAHLEQRDRGAAVLHVRLHLIKTDGTTREVHERSLQLPVAIRDARTLRTLALLDLESNPPPAAIDRVTVAVDPTPGRIIQFSLLTRPLPSPEQISTLMARLQALMGETRCGSPALIDSWEPGAFAMKPFNPGSGTRDPGSGVLEHKNPEHKNPEHRTPGSRIPDPGSRVTTALRRFRHPVPIRVHEKHGKPSSVSIMRRGLSGGAVDLCAGPWRTSGGWWESGIRDPPFDCHSGRPEQRRGTGAGIRAPETREHGSGEPRTREPGTREPGTSNPQRPEPRAQRQRSWDRDEWDVALTDGPTYRLFRERHSDKWFIEGVVD